MVVIGRRAGMENLIAEGKNTILMIKNDQKDSFTHVLLFSEKKVSLLVSVIFVLEILGFGLMGQGDKAQLRRLSVFIAMGTSLFFEGTPPFEELLLVVTRKSDAKRF